MRGGRYSLGNLCPCLAWHGALPLMWAPKMWRPWLWGQEAKEPLGDRGQPGAESSQSTTLWNPGPKCSHPFRRCRNLSPGFFPRAPSGRTWMGVTWELGGGPGGECREGTPQEARGRGAADFRASREDISIVWPAMRWHTAQWLLDSSY